METYQLAQSAELDTDLSPILSIGIGRGDNLLFLGADPETGIVTVESTGRVSLQFDADDFDLVNELLQRALGN